MTPDGLYPDRSEAEHRALPLFSPSGFGALSRSPGAWRWQQDHPIEPTPAMRLGTLIHSLALLGHPPDGWVVRPEGLDGRTREGRAWAADHAGATIIGAEDWERALLAALSVRSHPLVAEWLRRGQTEVSMVWTDPVSGVQAKGRADLVSSDPDPRIGGPLVADLKVLSSGPDLEPLQRVVYSSGYWLQVPWYAAMLEGLTGRPHTAVIIAVDSAPPHGVGVYPLGVAYQLAGVRRCRELLSILAECQATGNYWRDDRDTAPLGGELVMPRWAERVE